MFHGLWLIMALILAVSLSLYLVVMAVLVTAYLLFCGPYLWWEIGRASCRERV